MRTTADAKAEGHTPGSWQYEFPDMTDMPEIPAGFHDESWHNDTCPNFASDDETKALRIWIDYPDQALREEGGWGSRFVLQRGPYGEENETICETNDWQDILDAI
jgi:hypothetical protein